MPCPCLAVVASAAKTEDLEPGLKPFQRSLVALRVDGAAVRASEAAAFLPFAFAGAELENTDCPPRALTPAVLPLLRWANCGLETAPEPLL